MAKTKKILKDLGYQEKCPHCGFDYFYKANGHWYSKQIGIEDPIIYDGEFAWLCPKCNTYEPAADIKEWVDAVNKLNSQEILDSSK